MALENQNPKTVVLKFGGSSIGTPDAMRGVLEIIRQTKEEWPRVVVVISALAGVTNLLLDTAYQAARGDTKELTQALEKLRSLHHEIVDELVEDLRAQAKDDVDQLITEFANLCHAISILGEATPRALDAVASLGERMSVRLMAPALCSIGLLSEYVESSRCVITDDRYQNAHPDFDITTIKTREILLPLLESGKIPVVTGFIGSTPQGIITTLGRDGSDFSAAIVGSVLPADDVWIWTDVDGIMTADPRLVPNARTIPTLSYREMSELVYFGGKKPHPKAVQPVVRAGVGLRICNTFNPSHPGTRLITRKGEKNGQIIKAVAAVRGQCLITVEGRGMLGVPGVAARTFAAVASTGTSVPLITQASSEQSICFSVPADAADKVLTALNAAFERELVVQDIERIWASPDMSIVTTVGEGMRETPGVAGRIFTVLGEYGINVVAIAQGSSEVSISLVIHADETVKALKALHTLIEKDQEEGQSA